MGLPGILLALWILTLKEPVRRERPGVKADADKASIPDTNRFMLSKWRAYGSLIFGFAVLGMVINVYQIWGVQYFVRVLEMPLGEAGTRVSITEECDISGVTLEAVLRLRLGVPLLPMRHETQPAWLFR